MIVRVYVPVFASTVVHISRYISVLRMYIAA